MAHSRHEFIRKRPSSLSIPPPDRNLMRALEPRILLDAAGVETATDVANSAFYTNVADTFIDDNFSANPAIDTGLIPNSSALETNISDETEADAPPGAERVEIVFIAGDVADIEAFLTTLPPNTEVVILDDDRDGIAQIAEVLALKSNVDAIHIISHGKQGSLSLGTSELTTESMETIYAAQLALIGDALGEDGDILLYGCEFALGEVGREASDTLARLTGADVAASIDLTGDADNGGDWELEYVAGALEAQTLRASDSWNQVLSSDFVEANDLPISEIDADEAISSTRSVGQSFVYNGGGGSYQIDQVELVLRALGGTPLQDVTVSVRDTFFGPDLATGTISSSDLTSSYAWQTFTLDTALTLNTGQTYVWVISTDNASETVEIGADSANQYSNGNFLQPDGTPDSSLDTLFRLLDTSANIDPMITSGGGLIFADYFIPENQNFVVNVTASDPDPTDTLTYSITGGPDASSLTINPTTGELSFLVAPDFENPQDSNTNNIYLIIVQVDDGNGGTDSQLIRITVTDVNDVPVATDNSITIFEDIPHVFGAIDFPFTDDENDELQSLTITNLNLAGGTLTHSGGTVSVTNGMMVSAFELLDLIYTSAPDSSLTASFDYTVNDADAGIVAAQMLINVSPINDAPVITSGGGLTLANYFIAENQNFVVNVTASDPDPTDTLTFSIIGGTDAALFEINSTTGALSFLVAPDFEVPTDNNLNNRYRVLIEVSDNQGGIDTQLVRVTILDVNEVPIAIDGAVSTNEDTSFTFTAADFNFTDEENDALQSITISNLNLSGGSLTHSSGAVNVVNGMTVTLAEIADLTFTPAPNSSANASFDFTVNDANAGAVSASMNITVNSVNDVPVATGGAVTTNEDIPHTFIAADFPFTDVEGDALQSITVSNLNLASGSLVHSGGTTVTDGMVVTAAELASLIYTPALNSSANASFDYTVNDADAGTISAQMLITVTPVNDDPVIISGGGGPIATYFIPENQIFVANIIVSDPDPTATLTYSIIGGPDASWYQINPTTGELSFLVAPDFENVQDANGNNRYTVFVQVDDGNGGTDTQQIGVDITNVNELPVATGGAVTTFEDIPHVFATIEFPFTDEENDALQSLTLNNLNLAGGTLVHSGGTIVTNGMVITVAELASLTYTPALNSSANASFDYIVNDADTGVVAATMAINVTEVNDIPIITSGMGLAVIAVTNPENQTYVGTIVATDDDIPADTLTYSIIGGPDASNYTINPVTGDLSFLVAPNFENPTDVNGNGIYTVIVRVSDGRGGTDDQEIRVQILDVNDAPIATGSTVSTNEDMPHIFAATDFFFTDEEGDALQSITVSNLALAGGTLTHSGGSVTVINGSTITLAQLADLSFNPALNSAVNASFDYSVNDADAGTIAATMAITVNPVNDIPIAVNSAVTTNEDTPHVFAISDFPFTDIEGDALQSITVSNLTLAGGTLTHSGGSVTVTSGSTITLAQLADLTFTPALNSSANTSFDYTVNDADAGTVKASMAISVIPVNDVPVATGSAVATNEDTPHVFALTDFPFTDIEGDALQSITVSNLALAGGTLTYSGGTVTSGSTITLAQLADLTFTPALNSTTGASFSYTVNDADEGTVAASMAISITPVNDVPVAMGSAITTNEDTPHIFTASDFPFSDIEGDALQSITVSNLSLAGGTLTYSGGSVTVSSGSTITLAQLADLIFTPALNSTASAGFSYTVNDADAGTVAASMTIGISPPPSIPEPPTIPDPPEPPQTPIVNPVSPTVEEPVVESPEAPTPPPEPATTPPPAVASPPAIPPVNPAPIPVPVAPVSTQVVEPKEEAPEPELPAPVVESEIPVPTTVEPEETAPVDYGFTQVDRIEFAENLNRVGEDVRQYDELLGSTAAKVTFTFGSLLSVGGVSFILRGGALAAALLSALPAWNRFDPILVVHGRKDENDEEEVSDADMMLNFVNDTRSRVKKDISP